MRKEYFKINKKRYAKMTKAKTVDTVRERERERATARTLQLGYFGRLTPMFHFLLIWQP